MNLLLSKGFDLTRRYRLAVAIGLFAGLMCAAMGSALSSAPLLMAALPLSLACGLLFIVAPKQLMVLILLSRAALDPLLDQSKASGAGFGLGAIFNAFIVLLALALVLQRRGVRLGTLLSAWSPYLLLGAIGLVMPTAGLDATKFYLWLLTYFSVSISAYLIFRDAQGLDRALNVIAISSVVPVCWGVVNAAINAGLIGSDTWRLQAPFTHPNILAFYLTTVSAALLHCIHAPHRKPSSRWVLSTYLLLVLLEIVLTKTRSAWMATWLTFALFGLFLNRRLLVFVLIAPLLAMAIPGVMDRMADLNEGNEVVQYAKLNSFAWRKYIWESAMADMTLPRFIYGYGIEAFKTRSIVFFPMAGGIYWGAHSVYVQTLYELGTAGAAALVWLFFCVARAGRRVYQEQQTAALASMLMMFQFLIAAFSDNMQHYLIYNIYLWLSLGALLGRADALRQVHHDSA